MYFGLRMILNALMLYSVIFKSTCGLPFNDNQDAIDDKLFKPTEGKKGELVELNIGAILPKREESFHVVPVQKIEPASISPQMISAQHANPKKLFTSNVFIKRFHIDPKSEKLLYDPHQRGQLKIIMRDLKESQFDSNFIFKREQHHPTSDELQKRFFAGQQLAVLHGTMTQDQARESVRKQLNLFKDH